MCLRPAQDSREASVVNVLTVEGPLFKLEAWTRSLPEAGAFLYVKTL